MLWVLILKSLYFFLPAYVANMAPVLFRKLPLLNKPINEKRFGANKTWRGVIVATLMGGIVFSIQKYAHIKGFQALSIIDYTDFSILLGFFLGLGAILGDLLESYYKRKAGISPGKPWIPYDQLDFVLGGLIFGCFFYVPPANVILALFVVSPILHLGINFIGYLLKINKSKF